MWREGMWCDVMYCRVLSYDVMWCNVIWCEVMWCDAMRWDGMGCDVVVMRCGCETWLVVRSCDVGNWEMMCGEVRRTTVTAKPLRRPFQCALQPWDAKHKNYGEPLSQIPMRGVTLGCKKQKKATPSQSTSQKWNAKCTRPKHWIGEP